MTASRVCLLAGGTGGARLAEGLDSILGAGELTVITNTGDDLEIWGLHISPDTDSVLYRLAGIFNEEAGFGIAGDGVAALDMLREYREDTWFRLGDRDLATHILRRHLLDQGMTLSNVTLELGRRLRLGSAVVPMSDDPVRTWLETDAGRLDLQEYFVRRRCAPVVSAIGFAGAAAATGSPEAAAALEAAELVIIGPSNPLISIDPILAVLGPRLPARRTVAVSPIVAGGALKGPTVAMLESTGRDASALGVAQHYRRRAGAFVLDAADHGREREIEALGYRVLLTDTVMVDRAGAARLAGAILAAL